MDDSVADENANIWFVNDANEDGSISEDEIALVGVVDGACDFVVEGDNFA